MTRAMGREEDGPRFGAPGGPARTVPETRLADLRLVRLLLAGLIAVKVFDDFFATALTVAYRSGALGVAERLGRLTPGDDYRRLIPLMEGAPLWLHGGWVLAGALFLLAIGALLRRARWAYVPVLVAMGVEAVARVAERTNEAATGVIVNPNPSFIVTVVMPYVLPLLLALAVWHAGRSSESSLT